MDQKTRDRIDEYLISHSGVLRTSDFQTVGLHNSYLTELVEGGVLIRLKTGLYLKAENQTVSGFFEIQTALPSAVRPVDEGVTDDFMTERASQEQQERESFESRAENRRLDQAINILP